MPQHALQPPVRQPWDHVLCGCDVHLGGAVPGDVEEKAVSAAASLGNAGLRGCRGGGRGLNVDCGCVWGLYGCELSGLLVPTSCLRNYLDRQEVVDSAPDWGVRGHVCQVESEGGDV